MGHVSSEALHEVSSSRPTLAVFPNLRSIDGYATTNIFDSLLLQPSVKGMVLRMRQALDKWPSQNILHRLVSRVADRSPNIEKLEVIADDLFGDLEDDICRLVARLPMISELLVSHELTPKIARAAAGLARLRKFDIHRGRLSGTQHMDAQSSRITLEPGSFPSLQHLSLAASVDHAQEFFRQANCPASQFTSLWLHIIPDNTSSAILLDLMTTLSDTCPSLTTLKLDLSSHLPVAIPPEDYPTYSYRDILPVLRFRYLHKFHVQTAHPLHIMDDQVQDLVEKWPCDLEELDLNSTPLVLSKPFLSFIAITHFRRCSNLRHLGLYLDIDADPLLRPEMTPPSLPFSTLFVGSSPCHDLLNLHLRSLRIAQFLVEHIHDPKCLKWKGMLIGEESAIEDFSGNVHVAPGDRVRGWQYIWVILRTLFERKWENEERKKESALAWRSANEELNALRRRVRELEST